MNNEPKNESGKQPIKLTARAKRWIAGLGIAGVATGSIVAGVESQSNGSPESAKPAATSSQEATPSSSPSNSAVSAPGEKVIIRPETVNNTALVFTVKEGMAPIHFRTDTRINNDPLGASDGNTAFVVKPGEAAVLIRPVEQTINDVVWVGGVDVLSPDKRVLWADESELNHESTSYITQYQAPAGQPSTVSAMYEAGKGFVPEQGSEVVGSLYHGIPEDQAFNKYVQPNGFEATN